MRFSEAFCVSQHLTLLMSNFTVFHDGWVGQRLACLYCTYHLHKSTHCESYSPSLPFKPFFFPGIRLSPFYNSSYKILRERKGQSFKPRLVSQHAQLVVLIHNISLLELCSTRHHGATDCLRQSQSFDHCYWQASKCLSGLFINIYEIHCSGLFIHLVI